MNFHKKLFFFSLLLSFTFSTKAQNRNKDLVANTWYGNCNFNSDTLKLSRINTNNYAWQINFSPEGKLVLLNLKTKQKNTSYFYKIQKSTIGIYYDTKDSLVDLNYLILKNKKNQSFELVNYYGMRYKTKRKQDTPPANTFTLSKGKKNKSFEKLDEITVFRMKKGLRHDSIEIISKGTFQEIRSDTLILNAFQFSEHNFYKRYPDTNHYFSETLFDTLIQIKTPIKEITKIQAQREGLVRTVNTLAISALGVFFVSFPLAITVKSSDYGATFGQIAAYSALSIPVIVSVNMLFSKQNFELSTSEKNKDVWRMTYKK